MKGSTREGTPCCSIGRGVRELCSAKMLIIPGSVKSSFSSQRFHEELQRNVPAAAVGSDVPKGAVPSEGVDDTW
jgi:hypothetical protein